MLSRRGGQVAPRRAPAGFIPIARVLTSPAPSAMGCTASTPNTISVNGTDKNIQIIEETIEIPSETVQAEVERNIEMESNVLPSSCDNIAEIVQLSKANQSQASLQSEKEIQVNGHVNDIKPEPDKTEPEQKEEKIPKLEKLIDKVFEINPMLIDMSESQSNKDEVTTKTLDERSEDILGNESKDNTENQPMPEEKASNENLEIEVTDLEETPEDSSPSPSEFSRATRWEALADIVAELPPSLAIDPITGQIYSLTK